jgi:DNA-binding SARP family transcriptional activator/predicted ATPase
MASGLRVELLGGFRLTYDGQPVSGIYSRQQALLTCLILKRHRPLPRPQLAALFWPDSTDSQALTNLRRELHYLRRALPAANRLLLIEPASVGWREGPPSCDVCDFEAAIERGSLDDLQDAVRVYAGDLLPECYDDWIVPERERLRAMLIDALKRLITGLEERRAYADALQHARRLIALNPIEEDAYRSLMRLHALQGDRAAALRTYHTVATVLQRELQVEPDAETRAVYERLLGAEEQPPQRPASVETPPLVGRQDEWTRLLGAWHRAARGGALMTLIRGEAGIGKTRLAEELAGWCSRQGVAVARTRTYATEGGLAYSPVTEWLRSDALRPALSRLDTPWLLEVARLLPEVAVDHPGLPRPEPMTESWQRQRLFDGLARAILGVPRPLLLILDDLQWCDRDTLDWLYYVLRAHADEKLLIAGTLRTEEAADNPAISDVLTHLRALDRLVEIDLGPLTEAETAALAAHVARRSLDPQAAADLFRRTEGHPLFVVEMARAEPEGAESVPPKVQAVITARLSRLSQHAGDLARLAATIGRDFSLDVLREASDLDEKALVTALDELWQRRIIRERGTDRYDFSHDRVREVAYAETGPAARRLLHKRVAQALELIHGPHLDRVSAQLAGHYERAVQPAQAVRFYRDAATVARRVFASEEAIRYLGKALTLLRELPKSMERDREELALQLALSVPLFAARGWPAKELEVALERVRILGEQLGDQEATIHSEARLYAVHIVRANVRRSLEFARRVLDRAGEQRALAAASHFNVAGAHQMLGQQGDARDHFEEAVARYDPRRSQSLLYEIDALVFSEAWYAHTLWLLGHPDRAVEHGQRAIAAAERLQHPHNLALAHAYAALTFCFRRERTMSLAHAEAAAQLCARYGLAYYGDWETILQGWGLTGADPEAGITKIHQGLAVLRALGAEIRRPFYLSLLAEAHVRAGQPQEAGAVLDAALATAAQNADLWWYAELHRQRGALSDNAEDWFRRALDIARSQEARSLELRAAVSLARLWSERGARSQARELLAPAYEWFTEGLETADLIDARTLLATL